MHGIVVVVFRPRVAFITTMKHSQWNLGMSFKQSGLFCFLLFDSFREMSEDNDTKSKGKGEYLT